MRALRVLLLPMTGPSIGTTGILLSSNKHQGPAFRTVLSIDVSLPALISHHCFHLPIVIFTETALFCTLMGLCGCNVLVSRMELLGALHHTALELAASGKCKYH